MSYSYPAQLVRVIDGDTVVLKLEKTYTFDVDFGFYIKDQVSLKKETVQTFRLLGINAPETRGASKGAGLKAKAELIRLLSLGPIRVVSYKTEKYGRWLADLFVTLESGEELPVNSTLMSEGFATPYKVR